MPMLTALVLLATQVQQAAPQPDRTLGTLPVLSLWDRDAPQSIFDWVEKSVILDREHVALLPRNKREILVADREGHVQHRIDVHLDIDLVARFGPRRLIYSVYNADDPRTGQPCVLWSAGIDDDSARPFAACAGCEVHEL